MEDMKMQYSVLIALLYIIVAVVALIWITKGMILISFFILAGLVAFVWACVHVWEEWFNG
jgi:hypothetical protein